MQWPLGCFDDDQLRTTRFAPPLTDRNLRMGLEAPSGQDQIAVAALAVGHIQLIEMSLGADLRGQQAWLIVIIGSPYVTIHFLQANEIGLLLAYNLNDSFQPVATITTDAFVNVVCQQTHHN